MLLSFVIPCYRSERIIERVVNELVSTINQRSEYYEIILISDDSPDRVYDVIVKMAKENNQIKGIKLSRNFGQHAALMSGLRHARGDIIITLDDDGQTSPSDIFKLIDRLDEDTDVVYASFANTNKSLYRRIGTKINQIMSQKLIGKPKDIVTNSFAAYKSYIIKEVIRYENPYPYLAGLVIRATNKIANVTVEQYERLNGRSGYSLRKLFSLWLNGFTAFSIIPLRFATILGGMFSWGGFIFGLVVIIRKLLNPEIAAGYSSMIAILTLIGGMIMLMLGVIGEYVGRIYISINQLPQYVIKETVNIKTDLNSSP
jgi:undecaprenyl-phosphate 4-deoxy-4-formamido-L-arabinose transferase